MGEYREGDFLETKEGLIFHVKGILHPPNSVIAFLRYVPDEEGNRVKDGKKYRKIYSMRDKYRFLRSNNPEYIRYSERLNRGIQTVPESKIERVYKPVEKLKELREKDDLSSLEKSLVESSDRIIEESGVKPKKIGITGSILVGLEKEGSDIDLITYGEAEGRKVYSALKSLRREGGKIRPYNWEEALKIAEFRWKETGFSLKRLAEIERGKVLHGMMGDQEYFMRLVKEEREEREKYEDFSFSKVGKFRIEGTISEDSNSIFTPNKYDIDNIRVLGETSYEISDLFSYRGRFTEQVSKGDKFRAYGRVEKLSREGEERFRLLLGKPEEYLLPAKTQTALL